MSTEQSNFVSPEIISPYNIKPGDIRTRKGGSDSYSPINGEVVEVCPEGYFYMPLDPEWVPRGICFDNYTNARVDGRDARIVIKRGLDDGTLVDVACSK